MPVAELLHLHRVDHHTVEQELCSILSSLEHHYHMLHYSLTTRTRSPICHRRVRANISPSGQKIRCIYLFPIFDIYVDAYAFHCHMIQYKCSIDPIRPIANRLEANMFDIEQRHPNKQLERLYHPYISVYAYEWNLFHMWRYMNPNSPTEPSPGTYMHYDYKFSSLLLVLYSLHTWGIAIECLKTLLSVALLVQDV